MNKRACSLWLGTFFSVALVACTNKAEVSSQVPASSPPATTTTSAEKEPSAEKESSPANELTTIVGKAENARAGAVVMSDKGSPTYVEGLEEWEVGLYGKRVRVTGKLVSKQLGPPTRNAAGEIQAGMDGQSEVLEDATWELSPGSSLK